MRALLVALVVALLGCPAPRQSDDAECARDADCALLPYATCCGECPPAPPFDVGTRSNLDAIFIELETFCAEHRDACTPPVCDPVPAGCEARAACVTGRCVVVATDACGPRVSCVLADDDLRGAQ